MYYRVESSSRPRGSVEIYRPFGEPVRNEVVDYNIKSWISLYDRPFVYDYDDRTSKELYTEKRNGIILFVPTSEASLSLIAAFRNASEDLKLKQKKRLIFTQIEVFRSPLRQAPRPTPASRTTSRSTPRSIQSFT